MVRRVCGMLIGVIVLLGSVYLYADQGGPGHASIREVMARPVPSTVEELRDAASFTPWMSEDPELLEKLKRSPLPMERDNSIQEDPTGNRLVTASHNLVQDFEGISSTGWIPPDPVIAVGANDIVLVVNSSWAAYTKTGTLRWSQTLSDWFAPANPPGNIFDPKVIYDHTRDRWVMLALSKNATDSSSYLVSASVTSDPSGSWWLYKLDATKDGGTPTSNWADFPGLGYDDDALYITSNQYTFAGSFQYAKLRILHKDSLFIGAPVPWWDFWDWKNNDGSNVFTWKPAHTFGASLEYLLNTKSDGWDSVTLWYVTNPLGTPTLTRDATLPVSTYLVPPNAEQQGDTALIHTGDCRTQDVAVRDGYLYTAFSEGYDWGGGNYRSLVRFLKIDAISDSVMEDISWGSPSFDYYYPNVYPDDQGNATLVFNRSGATEFAGTRFTGKGASEGSWEGSQSLKAGEGPYVSRDGYGRNRWGDYSGAGLDPTGTSPRHVWIYSEYATPGSLWSTWVGEIGFVQPGVEEGRSFRPDVADFILMQNQPNPFRRWTVVNYALPEASRVAVEVFDVTGRLVETLVDKKQGPGLHRVQWEAENQATGIYFYRLQAGDFVETRKMTLLR